MPLVPVLNQVARRFRRISEQKGLYLRVIDGCAPDAGEVVTDRQKLERVVANLLDNALKFTERGGVTLELARHNGTTHVRVRDTGIGVPERDAPHLFDEFYQVDNHERDRSKGFGMGLAICRKLARELGGDVRLEHTGSGGSCFELLLDAPLAERPTVGPSVGPAAGADAGHRAGGGGRPGGAPGDLPDPFAAGLCGV